MVFEATICKLHLTYLNLLHLRFAHFQLCLRTLHSKNIPHFKFKMKPKAPLDDASPLSFELNSQACWSHVLLKPAVTLPKPMQAAHNGERFKNSVANPRGRKLMPLLKWLATRKSDTWRVNLKQSWQQHHSWQKRSDLDLPKDRPNASLDDWKVYFVSHATVLLQIGAYNFLTDPVWCNYVSHQAGLGPRSVCPAGIALEQLPTIHAVLLSHNHYDHLDLATLTWLHERFAMPIYTGLGNAVYMPTHWQVIEMDWWQRLPFAESEIVYVPAQHASGRGLRDQNAALWGGFSVLAAGGHAYFAGDTGYGGHFSQIREQLGAPRVALLPIGAYEPRELMRFVHMNPSDAVQAHLDLQSQCSIAIHFNRYQLTDEAREAPVQDLQTALTAANVQDAFAVLREGDGIKV